ncbi:hypothetical protein EBX93_18455 [bacterium]|nr:hypothetical protein [bacterium]
MYLFNDVKIAFAIGKYNDNYPNIYWFPIYLVLKDNTVIQIGLFEILSSEYTSYLNDDNGFNVCKLTNPVLYSFVDRKFMDDIDYFEPLTDVYSDRNSNEATISDVFYTASKIPERIKLKEETSKDAKAIKDEYVESKENNWVQRYMHNNNYNILDGDDTAECLFVAIRDAFATIGEITTIPKLRNKISNSVTEDIYNDYKRQYSTYEEILSKLDKEISELKTLHEKLSSDILNNKSIDEKVKIKLHRNIVAEEHNAKKLLKKDIDKLQSTIKYMKRINNVEQLRNAVRKCDFWFDLTLIPLVEDVDKVPGKSFWQYGPSCENVGLTGVEMLTVMV